MKIAPNCRFTFGLDGSAGIGTEGAGAASEQSAGHQAASDQVQLSSISSFLASALNGSPEHLAKMSELSAAVSSQQYHVNSNAVSGSIIQHSLEFGGTSYLALTSY